MAQNKQNIEQGEKLRRMAATSKTLKDQEASKPAPIWQGHTPTPEDIETFKRMGYGKDGWEILTKWVKDHKEDFKNSGLVGKFIKIMQLLFYVIVAPLGVKIIVELTAPRVTLSYLRAYLIAVGIVVIVPLVLLWLHKTTKD